MKPFLSTAPGIGGLKQSHKYILSLQGAVKMLSITPNLGMAADDVRAGYRRMVNEQHVTWYKTTEDTLLVVRILHTSMLPGLHLLV